MQFHLTDPTYRISQHETLAELRNAVEEGVFVAAFPGDLTVLAPGRPAAGEGWRCLQLVAEMAFTEVGIAAAVTRILADADISVLVMSGYKTDYFFVNESVATAAVDTLRAAGHSVTHSSST